MHIERDGRAKGDRVDARTAREFLRKDLSDEVGNLALRGELLGRLAEAFELIGKLLGRRKAVARLFGERLLKNLIELVGHVGKALFERRHRIHDDRPHGRGFGLTPVKRPPGERLKKANAQREDVQAMVGLTRRALLGRHVGELTLDHSGLSFVRAVVRFGNPEVEELHRAGISDHHIVRRHVAVNDIERFTMLVVRDVCVVKRPRHVDADADCDGQSHTSGLTRLTNQSPQWHSIDPFHHDEVRSFVRTELMELADVRMLELHPDSRLVEEHLNEVVILLEVRKNPLHH